MFKAVSFFNKNWVFSGNMISFTGSKNMTEWKVPTILLSDYKWDFLDHGAWRCLDYKVVSTDHIDVHCLNEPLVLSARFLILKEVNMDGSIMEQIVKGLWSFRLFTKGGTYVIQERIKT